MTDKAHAHFKQHVPAIVDAAKGIAETAGKLRRTNKLDDREQLHNTLDTQVAELHAAVNSATADPPEPAKKNTGGVANLGAINEPGTVDDRD